MSRSEAPMLEFHDAEKHFGPTLALDRCAFVARPGRLTGFLGPNGAGQTTAMRTVFGLVELDSGDVLWLGAPITMTERARFGYMPEERGLYPASLQAITRIACAERPQPGTPRGPARSRRLRPL